MSTLFIFSELFEQDFPRSITYTFVENFMSYRAIYNMSTSSERYIHHSVELAIGRIYLGIVYLNSILCVQPSKSRFIVSFVVVFRRPSFFEK